MKRNVNSLFPAQIIGHFLIEKVTEIKTRPHKNSSNEMFVYLTQKLKVYLHLNFVNTVDQCIDIYWASRNLVGIHWQSSHHLVIYSKNVNVFPVW